MLHIQTLSPELIRVANGLRATQLRVQVVVDSSHLSDSYPVLAFEWQPEGPPAQVGWHVQNKACHVGQLDATYIPERRKATFYCLTSLNLTSLMIGSKLWFVSIKLRPENTTRDG